MKRIYLALILVVISAVASAPAHAGLLFSSEISSDAIKGKVVDGATGLPLAGVLVVATWHDFTEGSGPGFMHQGGGVYYSCFELVNALTAVTGADGSYEIPAWSGKQARCRHMSANQPLIGIYKPGYTALSPVRVPLNRAYDSGPDHTVSEWDGHTFTMLPLGPHYFHVLHNVDNHVSNLTQFAWDMTQALRDDDKGSCFWDVERPLFLLLLQEQRRLSAYVAADFDVLKPDYRIPIVSERCAAPTAMAALKEEAQATPVEEPILPFVRNAAASLPQPQASAPPKELWDYLQEEAQPDHAADAQSIVYHIDLNPANPYFVSALSVGRSIASFEDAESWSVVSNQPKLDELARGGIYGIRCLDRLGPPGQMVVYQHAAYCHWVEALEPRDAVDVLDIRMPQAGANTDSYDAKTATWYLSEHSLVRSSAESGYSVVEFHGPGSISVVTTLEPAGTNRWRLPPTGRPFTMTVTDSSVSSSADVCAKALPPSLQLQLARDYSAYRLARTSDLAPGVADCPDVIKGNFDGEGHTDYAFHLLEYNLIQRLAVATPDGADWKVTILNAKGCLQPRSCLLMPAQPGSYSKTSISWSDPDSIKRLLPDFDDGERSHLQAANVGFAESWGAPVVYAHFFVDGQWRYVIVDLSSMH